jgi:hypothetical protein
MKYVPSFDDLAFANDEKTERLSRTRLTSSCVFFSSLYSSPKLISAVSYSFVAVSDVTWGAFDVISL